MTADNDEGDHENRDGGRDALSRLEVSEAIQRLTVEEKTELMKIAMALKWKTQYGHEDLIQEAKFRALSGQRAWRRDIPALLFFRGVMRSIAWEWRPDPPEPPPQSDPFEQQKKAARKFDAAKRIKIILSSFDDDPVAKEVVIEIMKGTPAQELKYFFMCKYGLSETEYESKRTKIRRRIEKIRREFEIE